MNIHEIIIGVLAITGMVLAIISLIQTNKKIKRIEARLKELIDERKIISERREYDDSIDWNKVKARELDNLPQWEKMKKYILDPKNWEL